MLITEYTTAPSIAVSRLPVLVSNTCNTQSMFICDRMPTFSPLGVTDNASIEKSPLSLFLYFKTS